MYKELKGKKSYLFLSFKMGSIYTNYFLRCYHIALMMVRNGNASPRPSVTSIKEHLN